MIKEKKAIRNGYNTIIQILNETLESVNSVVTVNKKFEERLKKLRNALRQEIKSSKDEVDNAINKISWDNLVIAFFGETNAGKSTIIETFRIMFEANHKKGNDGLIVGDGQLDFTKDYHDYKLTIKDKEFVLVDVPGIEGNEDEYKTCIKDALARAHCVFYVQAHNKKPDSATTEKIKQYLGDWVKVYSIQNVRGSAGAFKFDDERKSLFKDSVKKNGVLIEEEFKKNLGGVYEENITIQALLALCSQADFSSKRNNLKESQAKLESYFGNRTNIYSFSNFQKLVDLVEQKTNKDVYLREIVESNKQKMVSLAKRINNNIENVLKEDDTVYDDILRELKKNIEFLFSEARNALTHQIKIVITKEYDSLKNDINKLVDDEDSSNKKDRLNTIIADFQCSLKEKVKTKIKTIIETLKKQIELKKQDIHNIPEIYTIDVNTIVFPDLDVNLDDAMDELNVNFEDFADIVASVVGGVISGAIIGGAIGTAGGPVGMFVGAGIGLIGGIIKKTVFEDGGKGEAKKQISNALDKSKDEFIKLIKPKIMNINNLLTSNEQTMKQTIDDYIESISTLDEALDEFINKIKIHALKIKKSTYGEI